MIGRAVARFLLFWGTWLVIPIAIDVLTTLVYLWVAVFTRRRWRQQLREWRRRHRDPDRFWPEVAVIIPFRNAGLELWRCLDAVAGQTYPLDRLQVICVSNGTTDDSVAICHAAQMAYPRLKITVIELPKPSKSQAMNAGLQVASGASYFCLVDADARLHPDAIRRMVDSFEMDSTLGAATGSIQIDVRDLNRQGWAGVVQGCELLEYLSAFRVGRVVQTRFNALFTLAGAFSFYRRDVLARTFLFSESTVAEDTKMTRDIHELRYKRVVCIPDAVAYVRPVESLYQLYAQRARWQRGAIEVCALHPAYAPRSLGRALLSPGGRLLLGDHTLAFPRLGWALVLPALLWLGYPKALVLLVLAALYGLYVGVEALLAWVSLLSLRPVERMRWKRLWPALFWMPLYRTFIFLGRLAGMLLLLTEPPAWRVPNPFAQLVTAVRQDVGRLRSLGWRPLHPRAPTRGPGR